MFNMEKIGAFIASKRRESGLTQGQFAEKLNVTHQAVSKWERGEAMPEISKIGELSKTLGVSADEILVQMHDDRNEKSAENNQADEKYFSLGRTPSVSDVYELAPEMSGEVLSEAVHKLLRENGTFAITLFIPLLDKKTATQICERIYAEGGINGILFIGKHLPSDFVDGIILKEYGSGNMEAIKLLPFSKNDAVINAVFDSEVAKHGNWNSLTNVISQLPQSVVVKQCVDYARKHDLTVYFCWWNRFGRDTSALIMSGYAKACGYSADAWQHVARFAGNGNKEILRQAMEESIKLNGADSVAPIRNILENGNNNNAHFNPQEFNQNIGNIVNQALANANRGLSKAAQSFAKSKKSTDYDILRDIIGEYISELESKIDELEERFNDRITELEDRIDELED